MHWKNHLKYNPLPLLLSSQIPEINYFTSKELLGEDPGPIDNLWKLNSAQKIINNQLSNGSWQYSKSNAQVRDRRSYDLMETYRQLGFLVEMYGFNKSHPAINKTKDFIFSFETSCRRYSRNLLAAIFSQLYSRTFGIID